ncbi:hypothetical protein DL89DRAFT_44803, partial [Linderina pennispora]
RFLAFKNYICSTLPLHRHLKLFSFSHLLLIAISLFLEMVLIVELEPSTEDLLDYASSTPVSTSPTEPAREFPPEGNEVIPSKALDKNPLTRYLKYLITTRISLVDTYVSDLPGVYEEALSSDSSLLNTSTQSLGRLASASMQFQQHIEELSRIGGDISTACGALDTTIECLMRRVVAERMQHAIKAEFEDYFLQIAEQSAKSFDSFEFGLSPSQYLDDWIPSIVVYGGPTEGLNWRSFIISHASPLVQHYAKYDLESAVDWEVAKRRINRKLTVSMPCDRLVQDRDLIADAGGYQQALDRLSKQVSGC